MTVVGVTGPRPSTLDGDYTLTSALWQWIRARLAEAYEQLDAGTVISGMALGVDMLAAEVALERGLKLTAAIPFAGHDRRWGLDSIRRCEAILARADKVVTVSGGGYSAAKLYKRNEWVVDHADVMVAVWTGREAGGTFATMRHAGRRNKPLLRIDPSPMLTRRP